MTKILIATVKPFSTEAVDEVKGIFQEAGYEVEVLAKYAYFTENNAYNEFDDKVVAAFQKAMKYAVGTPAPYFEAVEDMVQKGSSKKYDPRVAKAFLAENNNIKESMQ